MLLACISTLSGMTLSKPGPMDPSCRRPFTLSYLNSYMTNGNEVTCEEERA